MVCVTRCSVLIIDCLTYRNQFSIDCLPYPSAVEFPRYNYDAYNAKKYRFVYGTTILRGDPKAKNGVR